MIQAHLFDKEKSLILVHLCQGAQHLISCLIDLIDLIIHLVLQVIMCDIFIDVLHDTNIFFKIMQDLFTICIEIQGCANCLHPWRYVVSGHAGWPMMSGISTCNNIV